MNKTLKLILFYLINLTMLRIAFTGPTRVGKSSAINSLVGRRVATVGLANTTAIMAEYAAKIGDIDCTLIDTPANYPLGKINNVDVVLYLTDANDGGINEETWSTFCDHFAALNKARTVPIQTAILITKCDTLSAPPSSSVSEAPPNILIAADDGEGVQGFYDPDLIAVIDLITKKYADACPVIPFNAHGRAAFHVDSKPELIKAEGRKALSSGYINLSVDQFYDVKTTGANFFELRQIMNMTDTLIKDIEKYNACTLCKEVKQCQCCASYNGNPVSYGSVDINLQYRISKTVYQPPAEQHWFISKQYNGNNTSCAYNHCIICLESAQRDINGSFSMQNHRCTIKRINAVSPSRCSSGFRACTFNIAHPCGQIASKLMELYNRTAPGIVRTAIIQFALNGQSQFGKSPNYNPTHWNIMATHLTFGADDLNIFGYEKAKTKDEAFRLLQFSRQKCIVDKINIYCAALRLPAEVPDSLRIKCINGEVGIFANLPIKNISDLKLLFNLIPTKRHTVNIDHLFSDMGEGRAYSPQILKEMPAIVSRINVDFADYDKCGLFK